MASTKISQLTEKTVPAGTEELVVNDSGVSKKIKISNLPDTDTTYSVGDGGLTEINFTSAKDTKLTGIETGATTDQTGAEIKTAYEAEANTNAFTDADHSKLDGIEASANNYSHPTGAGNEHLPATVSQTEAGYLNGVTSAIQTQIDGKEPSFTKNTGFNKNLGTTAGTVSEGNHNHTGVYEPADATIVKDADIGVTVQAYDADTVKTDAAQTFTAHQTFNQGVTVQGAGNLNVTNTAAGYGHIEMGGTLGGFFDMKSPASDDYDFRLMTDTTRVNFVTTAASNLPIRFSPENVNTLELENNNVTINGRAKGTLTTDNDGSFAMSASNNFKCTPAANFTLTFTNIASQSGFILLVNTGGHTVSAHANTKVDANMLATVSTAGTYLLSYFSDGTNIYMTNSAVYT